MSSIDLTSVISLSDNNIHVVVTNTITVTGPGSQAVTVSVSGPGTHTSSSRDGTQGGGGAWAATERPSSAERRATRIFNNDIGTDVVSNGPPQDTVVEPEAGRGVDQVIRDHGIGGVAPREGVRGDGHDGVEGDIGVAEPVADVPGPGAEAGGRPPQPPPIDDEEEAPGVEAEGPVPNPRVRTRRLTEWKESCHLKKCKRCLGKETCEH